MKSKPFYLSDDHTRSFGGKLSGFESRDEAMKEKNTLKRIQPEKNTTGTAIKPSNWMKTTQLR